MWMKKRNAVSRILMKRLDRTANSRGFLQLPLSREKVLNELEQCKDSLGIIFSNQEGDREAGGLANQN